MPFAKPPDQCVLYGPCPGIATLFYPWRWGIERRIMVGMILKRCLLPLLAILAVPFPAFADGVKVVELYSSLVCKYCPAAEVTFNEFQQKNPDVVALNCFVKTVDLRGDTISRPACNARQRYYASTLPNGSIGTPMYALNGREMVPHVKTEYEAFMRASLQAAGDLPVIGITPALTAGGDTTIRLPRLPQLRDGGDYTVWLATTRKPFSARVLGQPERHFTHVVRDMTKLTDWDGNRRTLTMKVTPAADTDRLVILAESPTKQVMAAGQIDWK